MDQLTAMRAFVRIAETGSFSAVARESQTTQATISKRIAALEDKLGVRLLVRSSREQSLTEAGESYYQQCISILDAVDEADNLARSQNQSPHGLLRITAAVDFAQHVLSPMLDEFMNLYPDIQLDLLLDNHRIDLVSAGVDIAIRADYLQDSALIARPLCSNPLYAVATPEYLQERGYPQHPDDLTQHDCLTYSPQDKPKLWTFTHDGKTHKVRVNGRFQCNNGDIQLAQILRGRGIAIMPYWIIQKSLAKQKLEIVLPDYALPSLPLNLVYPERKHLPMKTRYFLDFILEQAKQHPGLQ